MMIYLWEEPLNYLNRDLGEYDRNCSPDRFLLREGRKLGHNKFTPIPVVNFEISKKRILKFDCLPNTASIPLINDRVKKILDEIAPHEVQFFPAKILCPDGKIDGYYFLNITHKIKGIDHEKSTYTKVKNLDLIRRIHYLIYKPGCLKELSIARDEEFLGHLLINEKIKTIFEKEKITGIHFVRPEDYYRPLTAHDLIAEEKRIADEKNFKKE